MDVVRSPSASQVFSDLAAGQVFEAQNQVGIVANDGGTLRAVRLSDGLVFDLGATQAVIVLQGAFVES